MVYRAKVVILAIIAMFLFWNYYLPEFRDDLKRCKALCYPQDIGEAHGRICRCEDGSNPDEN